MDDVTRHPDDETLFDLVEDTIEPARAAKVRAHLARCSACTAFVAAARAGAPVTSSAVEEMPAEAAANLMGAVTTAWRDRVAGIAAAEAAQDAGAPGAGAAGSEIATTPVPVPGGEFAGYAPANDAARATEVGRPSARPRRRARRLVPVLAFVVLGTLAGTSILIGNDSTSNDATTVTRDGGAESADGTVSGEALSDPGSPEPSIAPSSGADEAVPDSAGGETGGAAAPATGAAGTESSANAEKSARDSTAAAGGATNATGVTAVPPPSDYDAFVDQDRTCIATLDEAQLALPDGRIPTQITQGPFGLYLVCG